MTESSNDRQRTAAGVAAGAVFIVTLLIFAKTFHLTGDSAFVWIIPPAVIAFLVYNRLTRGDDPPHDSH